MKKKSSSLALFGGHGCAGWLAAANKVQGHGACYVGTDWLSHWQRRNYGAAHVESQPLLLDMCPAAAVRPELRHACMRACIGINTIL